MAGVSELLLIDISSESDSENECEITMIISTSLRKKKSNLFLKKRKTHGEFALTKELTNEKFTNYFRLSRDQFQEMHEIIKNQIEQVGCNASRPIGTEEKLAVFLR